MKCKTGTPEEIQAQTDAHEKECGIWQGMRATERFGLEYWRCRAHAKCNYEVMSREQVVEHEKKCTFLKAQLEGEIVP